MLVDLEGLGTLTETLTSFQGKICTHVIAQKVASLLMNTNKIGPTFR